MTCREEVLLSAKLIVSRKGINEFSPQEIVDQMLRSGTRYKVSGIRTHVTARMCRNAPTHHAKKYDDFERIGHGRYRIFHRND